MTSDDFQVHVIDALARLDTKMTDLVGNGKPGRVGKLEEEVEDFKKMRWTISGIWVGATATISEIAHHFFFHK